jgi:hypothetical protein
MNDTIWSGPIPPITRLLHADDSVAALVSVPQATQFVTTIHVDAAFEAKEKPIATTTPHRSLPQAIEKDWSMEALPGDSWLANVW